MSNNYFKSQYFNSQYLGSNYFVFNASLLTEVGKTINVLWNIVNQAACFPVCERSGKDFQIIKVKIENILAQIETLPIVPDPAPGKTLITKKFKNRKDALVRKANKIKSILASLNN